MIKHDLPDEHITAWITRYAFTQGIVQVKGRVCHNIRSDMLAYGDGVPAFAHGCDWHRTEEAAKARADDMRNAKIKTLKRRIEDLEALVFLTTKRHQDAAVKAARRAADKRPAMLRATLNQLHKHPRFADACARIRSKYPHAVMTKPYPTFALRPENYRTKSGGQFGRIPSPDRAAWCFASAEDAAAFREEHADFVIDGETPCGSLSSS